MENNNMSAYLPTDLFEDSPLMKPKQSFNYLNQNDSSTTYTNSSNFTNGTGEDCTFFNRNLMKRNATTFELSNEEMIKRQLQSFSKKKMSDYSVLRRQIYPQYTGQQQTYYQNPPMTMISQGISAPQFTLVPPKSKMTHDTKPSALNSFTNQEIRMNKKFRTLQQPYGLSKHSNVEDENMLSEMTIQQVIEKYGSLGFVSIIKTYKGSKAIQKKINKIQNNEIDLILLSLMNYLQDVMCDYYGNYFLQKLIACCNPQQRVSIYQNIKTSFDIIAHNACGTHSIQSLIVLSNSKEEEALIKSYTEPNLLSLCLNNNSTHIIQKIIFSIPESRRDYINNFIISKLINFTLHSNGICLIKAFISNNQDENIAKMLIAIFELDTPRVISNQYGNFALQELIRKFGFESCSRIIKKIKDKIVLFSSMKYSSNVIDFVISHSHLHNKELFIEITTNLFFNLSTFDEMTKNKYGNFVLENAILLLDQLTLGQVKEFLLLHYGSLNIVKDKEKKIFKLLRNECK